MTFNRLVGTDIVLANLNREIRGIRGRTKKGVRTAALLVKRESQKLTPIDTGNLKGSAYTEVVGGDIKPGAIIGYTANYAPFVHEINKNYIKGQWKFLETAIKNNEFKIIKIIQDSARV